MKITPIQTDFSGGEISPKSRGRSDTRKYRTGVKKAHNFVISPQGTLVKRAGFNQIAESSAIGDDNMAIFSFPIAGHPDALIEMVNDKIRIRGQNGPIIVDDSQAAITLVTNGEFNQGGDGLLGWDSRRRFKDEISGKVSFNSTNDIPFINNFPAVVNNRIYLASASQCTFQSGPTWRNPSLNYREFGNIKGRAETTKKMDIPVVSRNKTLTVEISVSGNESAFGVNKLDSVDYWKARLALYWPNVRTRMAPADFGIRPILYNRKDANAIPSPAGAWVLSYGRVRRANGDYVFIHIGTDNVPVDYITEVQSGPYTPPSNLGGIYNNGDIDVIDASKVGGLVHIGTTPYGAEIATYAVNALGDHSFTFNSGSNSELYITLAAKDSENPVDVNKIPMIDENPSGNSYDPSEFTTDFSEFKDYFLNINTVVVKDIAQAAGGILEFTNPFPQDKLSEIRTEFDDSTNSMYFVQRDTAPQIMTATDDALNYTFGPATTTGANFGAAGSYPGIVEIRQGRLWLLSSKEFLSRIWGSHAGDYTEFGLGASLDNEGIDKKLATKGKMVWAKSTNDFFIIGTTQGLYALISDGAFITPTDIGVDRFADDRCADIEPISIGSRLVFVPLSRRKIVSLLYSDQRRSHVAINITKFSDHVISSGVKKLLALGDPDHQLILLSGDHVWSQCTYDPDDPDTPIAAWHTHSTLEGSIVDATIINEGNGDTVFALMSRLNGVFIESMNPNTRESFLADSLVKRFAVNLGTDPDTYERRNTFSISGMDAFINTSNIVAYHRGALLFNENSNLRFEANALLFDAEVNEVNIEDSIHIGFNYTATAIMLNPETFDPINSMLAMDRRIQKTYLYIVDSYLPKVNGQLPNDRSYSTPLDQAEPVKSEVVEYSTEGHLEQTDIIITQDLPLAAEIASILYEIEVERS